MVLAPEGPPKVEDKVDNERETDDEDPPPLMEHLSDGMEEDEESSNEDDNDEPVQPAQVKRQRGAG
eukprot:44131-Ditylum_brightwellii.AAC.2